MDKDQDVYSPDGVKEPDDERMAWKKQQGRD